MPHIRRGDVVEVLAGNDRGKRGKVLRVLPEVNRVVVEGINVRWKHMRKSQKTPQGGRLQREMPIHRSNVMVYDEAAKVRSRLGIKIVEGKKVRILRKTGAAVGATAAAAPVKEKKAPKKRAAKGAAESKES